jgi:hypothetical protein
MFVRIDGGAVRYETIERGAIVRVQGVQGEWSRVRVRGGRVGLVATERLKAP